MVRCIVLVVGVPGVGKSTLARALLSLGTEGGEITHVEFDALYNADAQGAFSPQQWKRTREKMFSLVQSQLSDPAASRTVVVDDNFQYRSMRLQYARLAAECSASFCTVYLRCGDPALAKRMNGSRSGAARVPDPVIDAMYTALEPPDPARYPWEENVYVVDVESAVSSEKAFDSHAQSICAWLMSVSKSPVVLTRRGAAAEVPEQLRAQSREANLKSEKHQFDLWSRKVVASVMSAASPSTRASVASVCAAMRRKYLSETAFGDEAKSGFLRELTNELSKLA